MRTQACIRIIIIFSWKKSNTVFYLVKNQTVLSLPDIARACHPDSRACAYHDYRAAHARSFCITRRIRKLETDYLRCRNEASHGVMCRHKDSSSALTVSLCGSSLSSAVNEGCFLQEPDHIALPSPGIVET